MLPQSRRALLSARIDVFAVIRVVRAVHTRYQPYASTLDNRMEYLLLTAALFAYAPLRACFVPLAAAVSARMLAWTFGCVLALLRLCLACLPAIGKSQFTTHARARA